MKNIDFVKYKFDPLYAGDICQVSAFYSIP